MYKNKLSKLLFVIIIFMIANVTVFAGCKKEGGNCVPNGNTASCGYYIEFNTKICYEKSCKSDDYTLKNGTCVKTTKKTCRDFGGGCPVQDDYGNKCGMVDNDTCAYTSCSSHSQSTCGKYILANGKSCEYKNNTCVEKGTNPEKTGGSTCSGYEYNGGCYKLDEFNCKYFGFSWENGKCNTNKKCGVGNYYNNDSSKAAIGCYKADKENCNTFGYIFENGECNYSKTVSNKHYEYKVLLNSNYGSNFSCVTGYNETNNNPVVCETTTKNVNYTFPGEYNKAYYGQYSLLGWSKTVESGKLVCSTPSKTIIKNSAVLENKDNVFYACYKDEINGKRFALNGASADGNVVKCGTALDITYCYKDTNGTDYCHYKTSSGQGLVYRNKISDSSPSNCDVKQEQDDEIKCVSTKQRDIKEGKYSFYMCLDKNYDDEYDVIERANDLVRCESGLELDEDYTRLGSGSIDDEYIEVTVKCVDEEDVDDSVDINLSVSSANVGSNGEGVIRVNARSNKGNIRKYYYSSEYKTPTSSNDGWEFTNSNSFSITTTPGTIYVWVMDSDGNISRGISAAVFDNVNVDTTISKLELYDSNDNLKKPTGGIAYKEDGISSSDYVRLSNRFQNESKVAEKDFNPFDMEYKVEVDSPTLSVYATLTSNDSSYVEGYEPRTVNLEYGINTILIKIRNKEGKTRTYTILATRVDDRTADNTISDLTLSVGKINFNANKAEYKVEIPKDTKSVNINATLGSDKAKFVEGYEPGNVEITSDSTVKLIKVMSQAGTVRTYVLNFIIEGTDLITDKSLQLFSLNIPGVKLAFEKNISNYNVTVGYSTDIIDIDAVVHNKDSKVIIKAKKQSDLDYNIVSNKGISLDVGENFIEIVVMKDDGSYSTYRLVVIRKEFGLELSNDTTLKDLKVLGYDINFDANKKEYTIKIKQEKSLVVTAVPNSNRSEVFIRGNDELTGFSTVRVQVIAENGDYDTYSVDIKKDAFNKTIEIAAIVIGAVIILGSSCIIVIKNNNKKKKEYYEE